MVMKNNCIEDVTFWPIDMPITIPFVEANVFVHITFSKGTYGYGEAA